MAAFKPSSEPKPDPLFVLLRDVEKRHGDAGSRPGTEYQYLLEKCHEHYGRPSGMTAGQLKWLRCCKRSDRAEDNGRPEKWKGDWLIGVA